jgi:hypothetical protein
MQARVAGALLRRIVDIQEATRTALDDHRIHTDVRRPVKHRPIVRVPDVDRHGERAVAERSVLDRLHLELNPSGPFRRQIRARRVLAHLDSWGRRVLAGVRTSAALGRPDQAHSTDHHADQSSDRTSPNLHSLIHGGPLPGLPLASLVLSELTGGQAHPIRPHNSPRTPAPPASDTSPSVASQPVGMTGFFYHTGAIAKHLPGGTA